MTEIEEKNKPGIFFYIFFVALPIAMGLLLIYLIFGLAFFIDKENKSQWNKEPAVSTEAEIVTYVKEHNVPVYLDGVEIDIDSVDIKYYNWSFNEEKNVLRLHTRNQSTTIIPVPIFMQ